jgi:diguanylate cyclase (GGDEF)-like protein/PAS domain S-box-containing protein
VNYALHPANEVSNAGAFAFLLAGGDGGLVLVGALVLMGGAAAASLLYLHYTRRLRELDGLYKGVQDRLEVMAVAFNCQVGLLVTDKRAVVVRANEALCNLLGSNEKDLIGSDARQLKVKGLEHCFDDAVLAQLRAQGFWRGELQCRNALGKQVPCIVTLTAVRTERSGLRGFVGSFVDITEQKRTEAQIRHLAYFDPLTRLPNRRMFLERLHENIANGVRDGALGALVIIDLDQFKFLNDAHGHSVGDELLRLIAERLRHLCSDRIMAARLGGDEFVLMLTNLGPDAAPALTRALTLAQTVKETILSPFLLSSSAGFRGNSHQLRYSCSGSMGVALFALALEDGTEVLKRADLAMYQAKHAGRNTIRQYDPSVQKWVNHRLDLLSEMNMALAEGHFQLHYQIQVDHRSQPVGAECLLRWNHPVHGLVPPTEFIPLAEDSGAILSIGRWVLRSACETLRSWADHEAFRDLTLSVNVSPKQFIEADFIAHLSGILAQTGARADRLILEITEGTLLLNIAEVIDKMNALRRLGVRFSIDDFGTGYSSLSYLHRLPISELKIDRAFVQNMTDKEESYAIVSAIIALAGKLNFKVVSEGVETAIQKNRLQDLGSTIFQGFLISRPVDIDSFEKLAQSSPAPLTWH